MSTQPVRAEELLLTLGASDDPFEATMTLTAASNGGDVTAITVPLTPSTLSGLLEDLQHIDQLQRTELDLPPREPTSSPPGPDAGSDTSEAPAPTGGLRRVFDPAGISGLRRNPRSTKLFTAVIVLVILAGVIAAMVQR